MNVTVQYRYPSDVEQNPQAKVETESFEIDEAVFEKVMALLSKNSTS